MLAPVRKQQIRAASVDLELGEIFRIVADGVIDIENDQWPQSEPLPLPYVIKPGEYVLARTIQVIKQPHQKYGVWLSTRSRAFRIGLSIQCGFFGPFYEGPIVFAIRNNGPAPVKLYKGMGLIQAVFNDLKGESKEFTHDFQGGRIL